MLPSHSFSWGGLDIVKDKDQTNNACAIDTEKRMKMKMCENKNEAKKLSVKTFLMPFHSELKRWYDDVIKAYSSCPPLFSCWASRAVRKIAGRVGMSCSVTAGQGPLGVSTSELWLCIRARSCGKKRGHRAGLSACWLLLRCSCDLFAQRQFVCLKARVMCLCKYALAFLPPNSNTMIIYFTLPTPHPHRLLAPCHS